MLLEFLRNFAGHRTLPLLAEKLCKLLQCLYQTVRRFVENHCSCLLREFGQTCLPSLLLRQESFKAETVARVSGRNKSRNKGSRARQGLHLDSFLDTCPYEQEARIGNSRSTGIADQSDIESRQNALLYHGRRLVFVELMMRLETSFDFIMLEKYGTCPGILRQYEVCLLKHPYSSEGHILQIAHRGRNYV